MSASLSDGGEGGASTARGDARPHHTHALMPQRFTIVSAPLEGRVGEGIARSVQEVMAMGSRLKENVNDTLHDDALSSRAAEKVARLAMPSGLPFMIFCTFVAVFAFRELLVRIETRSILNRHASTTALACPPNKTREHDD